MINFEMPNELIIVPKRSKTKEEIAWENTLAVHDWIWKCLQKRKIPYEDMDDAFSACQIEVYKLMLQYFLQQNNLGKLWYFKGYYTV